MAHESKALIFILTKFVRSDKQIFIPLFHASRKDFDLSFKRGFEFLKTVDVVQIQRKIFYIFVN